MSTTSTFNKELSEDVNSPIIRGTITAVNPAGSVPTQPSGPNPPATNGTSDDSEQEPESGGSEEYTVDVTEKRTGIPIPGVTPLVGRFNEMNCPQKGQEVLIGLTNATGFASGSNTRAYILGILHTEENPNPPGQPGDWRELFSEGGVIESVFDDGERLIRIGGQENPGSRGDLDAGLYINVTNGKFELYDQVGNGICCDGEGGILISGVTEGITSNAQTAGTGGGPQPNQQDGGQSGNGVIGGGPGYQGTIAPENADTVVPTDADVSTAMEQITSGDTVFFNADRELNELTVVSDNVTLSSNRSGQ